MLDIDSSDARLADLSWRPKTATRHVEDIFVQNRSSLAPLHFVALAGLVDLRVLRLPDRGASSHCPMRYGADTERLLHSLKKLHTLSLSGFWSVPPQTLPDWLVRLNIRANMLHNATALDLSTTRLRRLHLFFDGRETHLSALPWHTLEHLSVRSISSNLELPFAMPGQQVRLHARVVIVSQTEGRNSRNAPLLKQTNGGLQAGQLRALVLDLKREGRSGPLNPLKAARAAFELAPLRFLSIAAEDAWDWQQVCGWPTLEKLALHSAPRLSNEVQRSRNAIFRASC